MTVGDAPGLQARNRGSSEHDLDARPAFGTIATSALRANVRDDAASKPASGKFPHLHVVCRSEDVAGRALSALRRKRVKPAKTRGDLDAGLFRESRCSRFERFA